MKRTENIVTKEMMDIAMLLRKEKQKPRKDVKGVFR